MTDKAKKSAPAEPNDAERIWAKPPLEVFLEGGRAGLKNRDGEVVVPPEWGQIEITETGVVLRDVCIDEWYGRNGGSSRSTSKEDDHFFRDGKVGLMKDGKVWFDAAYDEIDDWSRVGFDVVYTRTGKEPRYFTGDGHPVLTQWRRFPDLPGEEEPYFVYEKQNPPTLVVRERGNDPADPQSCRFKDGIVRFDRMRKSDVLPLFANATQVRKENAYRLAEFDCAFTYIYNAYIAHGRGADALETCFRDFEWMDAFKSSWERLILVSVSPCRKEPLDVRVLVRGLDEAPDWEPTGDFAVGFDESLWEDEVRVFMVRYFADHWPSQMENHCVYARETYLPSAIKTAEEEWRHYLEDASNFTSAEGQAAYRLLATRPPEPSSRIPPGRSWRTIVRTCRMLVDAGATLEDFAWRLCAKTGPYTDDEEIAPIADNLDRLLGWALAHGSNPNHVVFGKTCLDSLDEVIGYQEELPPERREMECLRLAKRMRERILAAGGKCRAELLADRSPVWLDWRQVQGGTAG